MAKKKKPIGKKKTTKPKKKSGIRKPVQNVKISIGAINGHITAARKGLEDQLARKFLAQYKATTKTEKKKIGRDISRLKGQITKLK